MARGMIAELVAQGLSKDAIVDELVARGVSPEQAALMVAIELGDVPGDNIMVTADGREVATPEAIPIDELGG